MPRVASIILGSLLAVLLIPSVAGAQTPLPTPTPFPTATRLRLVARVAGSKVPYRSRSVTEVPVHAAK